MVGDGSRLRFWHGPYCGGRLSAILPDLFRISQYPDASKTQKYWTFIVFFLQVYWTVIVVHPIGMFNFLEPLMAGQIFFDRC